MCVCVCVCVVHLLVWIINRTKCTIRTSKCFSYILLQSALQPLWVLACSTIVEYSQQEGFYRVPLQRHVKPPTWRTSD